MQPLKSKGFINFSNFTYLLYCFLNYLLGQISKALHYLVASREDAL